VHRPPTPADPTGKGTSALAFRDFGPLRGAAGTPRLESGEEVASAVPVGYIGVLAVAVLLFAAILAAFRALIVLARLVSRLFGRWIPPAVARPAAVTAFALLTLGLLGSVVNGGLMSPATSMSQGIDNGTESTAGHLLAGLGEV
jgi:hypothetical protein